MPHRGPGVVGGVRRTTLVICMGTLFVLGVATCDDQTATNSAGPTTNGATGTTTTVATSAAGASVAEKADAICTELDAVFSEQGPFPFDDFDPDAPDPDMLPAVGEYFRGAFDESDDAVDQLKAIEGGTATEREQLDAFIEAAERNQSNARTQADAARDKDIEGFLATLPISEETGNAVSEAAMDLGAPACAF